MVCGTARRTVKRRLGQFRRRRRPDPGPPVHVMNPAIEQLQARAIGAYTQLQTRERVLVGVGAAVLAVLIDNLGIWVPLVKWTNRTDEAMEMGNATGRVNGSRVG